MTKTLNNLKPLAAIPGETFYKYSKLPEDISYVIYPREYTSDFREGLITPEEWKLLVWLRGTANVYGVTAVNLRALKDDLFRNITENAIQLKLKSLLTKKYIYYKDHRGKRGSFDVHLDKFLTPKGYKSLCGEDDVTITPIENGTMEEVVSEVNQNSLHSTQRFESAKSSLTKAFSIYHTKPELRPSYNDTNNNTNNDIIDSKEYEIKIPTSTFNPSNSEEARCLEFAKAFNEPGMDSILSNLKKYGIDKLEWAYAQTLESISMGTDIRSAGAYFNRLLNPK